MDKSQYSTAPLIADQIEAGKKCSVGFQYKNETSDCYHYIRSVTVSPSWNIDENKRYSIDVLVPPGVEEKITDIQIEVPSMVGGRQGFEYSIEIGQGRDPQSIEFEHVGPNTIYRSEVYGSKRYSALLCATDNGATRSIVQEFLQNYGFDIHVAANRKEAIERIKKSETKPLCCAGVVTPENEDDIEPFLISATSAAMTQDLIPSVFVHTDAETPNIPENVAVFRIDPTNEPAIENKAIQHLINIRKLEDTDSHSGVFGDIMNYLMAKPRDAVDSKIDAVIISSASAAIGRAIPDQTIENHLQLKNQLEYTRNIDILGQDTEQNPLSTSQSPSEENGPTTSRAFPVETDDGVNFLIRDAEEKLRAECGINSKDQIAIEMRVDIKKTIFGEREIVYLEGISLESGLNEQNNIDNQKVHTIQESTDHESAKYVSLDSQYSGYTAQYYRPQDGETYETSHRGPGESEEYLRNPFCARYYSVNGDGIKEGESEFVIVYNPENNEDCDFRIYHRAFCPEKVQNSYLDNRKNNNRNNIAKRTPYIGQEFELLPFDAQHDVFHRYLNKYTEDERWQEELQNYGIRRLSHAPGRNAPANELFNLVHILDEIPVRAASLKIYWEPLQQNTSSLDHQQYLIYESSSTKSEKVILPEKGFFTLVAERNDRTGEHWVQFQSPSATLRNWRSFYWEPGVKKLKQKINSSSNVDNESLDRGNEDIIRKFVPIEPSGEGASALHWYWD